MKPEKVLWTGMVRRSNVCLALVCMLGFLLVVTSVALARQQQQQEMKNPRHQSEAFKTSTLVDYDVVNQRNETVGVVEDFVMTPQGHIQYVVISPASWWGAADRLYLIPWTTLTPNRGTGTLLLNMSQERLQNAPSFTRNNWPNLTTANWDAAFQRYYSRQEPPQSQQADQQASRRAPRTDQPPVQFSTTPPQRSSADVITQAAVLFDFAESRLNAEARTTLDRLVSRLRTTDFAAVHLTGHADSTGSSAANFALARQRAMRVAAYLVQQGVEPSRITVLSLGEGAAAPTGQEAQAMPQNRRVDIAVLRPGAASARQGTRPGSDVSATVQDINRDNGTVTVQTDHGDTVELRAREGQLRGLQAGDRVEVRLRKLDGTMQQSR